MKILRKIFSIFFFWLIFSGFAFCAPPARIVSLAPSLTEILYNLGLKDNIVAVTNFCDYPPEVAAVPKIGGFSNPSLEAIISVKPDIVVMSEDGNPPDINDRLKRLGIKTYVFKARRIAELPLGMRELGIALGVSKMADKRAKRVEQVIKDYENRTKRKSDDSRKKAIFIISPEPLIVAGPGTVIDDALQLLGLENIAWDTSARYPKYSIEELISRSPDYIFIGKGQMTPESSLKLEKRLASLKAIKKGRIYYTSESLYRLSPRVVEGIEEIAGYIRKR